ncbi:MAG: YfhO family protein [Chitinophagaceae bacterium]
MNKGLLKKILPHLLAVLIFLIVSVFFNKPALEGNVLGQHDILGWKGMAQNAFDYKAKTGHYPLWNTNVFSGMPNYLIVIEGKSILPDINKIIGLGLPAPINYFFIACICFYILCLALGLNPMIGIMGALAYAFATYNPIIINAGHITKMFAIAYMPLLLAGMILSYHKKYWLGLAVTTLGAYLQISANHPQISYYFFIIAFFVTVAYIVYWVQKKEWKHMGLALGITAISVIAGVATHALSFLTTSEYSKATMRGGKTISIEGDKVQAAKTTGLDTSYAFSYSLGKGEVVTMIMPNAYGGSAKNANDENSAVVSKLVKKGAPEGTAIQIASSLPKFWGESDSTSGGPLYAGAIICILAIIGFVLYKKPLRWALLAVSVVGMLMAWGRHFPSFNLFLFNHLPLYDKFRAPSITMVILQFTIPVAAVLGLQELLYREKSKELLKADFKKIIYAVGGLVALLGIMYLMMDYSSSIDQQVLARQWDQSGTDEIGRQIVAGLKEDRKSLFGMQLLRTIGFAILVLGMLYLYLKNVVKQAVVVAVLGLITVIDLLVVDKDYLNDEDYHSKDEIEAQTNAKTAIDEQILQDKSPDYRVYSLSQERFSASDYHVSTFHKAIGGYHPAKLRIYQDIIERYLSGGYSPQILNMLNTKYIIMQDPQTGKETLMPNTDAYGPCWLVKHVKLVKDDVEEIQAIGTTNLKDTAVVQQAFANLVTQPVADSLSTITLAKFDNDEIEYSADCRSAQFAVFSEVYYPYGWNAYIDGKKTEYTKTDYVLRGISIPAGKHTVKFAFEPTSYKKGITIAYIGSYLVALFFLGGLFMAWRENKKKKAA